MQLAPSTAPITPTHVHGASDVVSPSRLFAIAATRLDGALRILGTGDTTYAPSSLSTSVAIREALSGIGALQSVMVPSTPWEPRQAAASAMRHADHAVDQLRSYSTQMAPRGEGPFQRGNLPLGMLALLDSARAALRLAIRDLP